MTDTTTEVPHAIEGTPLSRYTAADILRTIADDGQDGNSPFPNGGCTPYDLGRALARLCPNAYMPYEEFMEQFNKGFSKW
ncbi:MAG: hypothetical protein KBB75_00135 [Candidatus Pacebacteria bacterium]|jgi:hypothetical protein|nr:hypothetical protein [Candidatus Paceibacterota bacterium]